MKKSFKRAGIAVLSMSMLLSMGAMTAITTNAADENYTVHASGVLTSSNATYKVYKVADNVTGLIPGWSLPEGVSGWSDYSSSSTAADMKLLAATLAGQTPPDGTLVSATSSGVNLETKVKLDDGYYLVIVTPSSVDCLVEPMLVQVKDGVPTEAGSTAKVQSLTLTKAITDVDDDTDKATTASTNASKTKDSTAVAGVGNTVSYTIDTSMPKYAPTATVVTPPYIQDTPTNLDDNNTTIKVFLDGTEVATNKDDYYSVNVDSATDGATDGGYGFKITFTQKAVSEYGGKSIQVTYDAVVLENANVGTTGNPNTAKIVYNSNYLTGNTPADDGKEVDDEAEVYTAPLKIVKKDGNGNTLKDVQFTLKNSEDKYVKTDGTTTTNISEATYTTTENNAYADIEYSGLKDGNYTLTEVQGVANYRPLTSTVTVTITAGKDSGSNLYNGTYTYEAAAADSSDSSYVSDDTANNAIIINNAPINSLPGTGGMGTVLFTVGGAAIVLLAGALFVVYMKKRKIKE